jgi:hypothetical protein
MAHIFRMSILEKPDETKMQSVVIYYEYERKKSLFEVSYAGKIFTTCFRHVANRLKLSLSLNDRYKKSVKGRLPGVISNFCHIGCSTIDFYLLIKMLNNVSATCNMTTVTHSKLMNMRLVPSNIRLLR